MALELFSLPVGSAGASRRAWELEVDAGLAGTGGASSHAVAVGFPATAYSQRVLVLGVLFDAVGQLGDLVVERPPLGHVLPDLAVGVHDRGVVAAAERLPDARQ